MRTALRTVVSLLAAVLAALCAALATAGALVDEAAHRPDLLRGITETVASDDGVRAAIPGAVTDVVEDAVPEQIPDQLTQIAEDIVRPIAQRVAEDPNVVAGWSDTADAARRAWLNDLAAARETDGFVPGGEFHIPFGPVAQTGLAAALGDTETRLREDQLNLPGQGLVEGLLGVDVGDWAADNLVAPMYDRAAQLRDSTDLTMTVKVDSLAAADRSTVAWWVAASSHWVWAAVASGLLLLTALAVAPWRRRGIALALSGALVLLGAWFVGEHTASRGLGVSAPEGATPGMAALVRAVEAAARPALETAVAPYVSGLLTAGWIALAVGAVVVAIELLAGRRVRPRNAR